MKREKWRMKAACRMTVVACHRRLQSNGRDALRRVRLRNDDASSTPPRPSGVSPPQIINKLSKIVDKSYKQLIITLLIM